MTGDGAAAGEVAALRAEIADLRSEIETLRGELVVQGLDVGDRLDQVQDDLERLAGAIVGDENDG